MKTFLKILYSVLFVAVTAFLVYGLLDIVISPSENASLELALYLTFNVIIIGSIAYIITLIPAIIGLISSIVAGEGGNIVFFIIAVLLPFIAEFIIITVSKSIVL